MGVLQKKSYKRVMADIGSILECLYEVYEQEGTQIQSGNTIYSTMIYTFLRMLEKQCGEISAEKIHMVLWKEYLESSDKADFVEKAEMFINPYVVIQGNADLCCCC